MRLRRHLRVLQGAVAILGLGLLGLGAVVLSKDPISASPDSAMAEADAFLDAAQPLNERLGAQGSDLDVAQDAIDQHAARLDELESGLADVRREADAARDAASEAYDKALEPCLIHGIC